MASIDANAFLDPEAFATLLGVDGHDWIDLPAGFIERALTQLHAKGYGALARRAEKHDERYVRRLRQNAWNFDFSDAETSPRAELGLRDRMTPLGKLFIPAKSVKIGTGGAVAAPTTGRHGVSATTWARLGELTIAAKQAADRAVLLSVFGVLEKKGAMPAKVAKCNEILDKAKVKTDDKAEFNMAVDGAYNVDECLTPFERLAKDSKDDSLRGWYYVLRRCSLPIGQLAIAQSFQLIAECIGESLFAVALWKNTDFVRDDDTLVLSYDTPGNAEVEIVLGKTDAGLWYVIANHCTMRVKLRLAESYELDSLFAVKPDRVRDEKFELDFDSASDKEKDAFENLVIDYVKEWFGDYYASYDIDSLKYMASCDYAMDEASKLFDVAWGFSDVTAKDKQGYTYARLQIVNDYLNNLLTDEAGYVLPVGAMLGVLNSKQYDYLALLDEKGIDD